MVLLLSALLANHNDRTVGISRDLKRDFTKTFLSSAKSLKTEDDQITLLRSLSNLAGDLTAEDHINFGGTGHLVSSEPAQSSLRLGPFFLSRTFRHHAQEGNVAFTCTTEAAKETGAQLIVSAGATDWNEHPPNLREIPPRSGTQDGHIAIDRTDQFFQVSAHELLREIAKPK